MKRRHQWSAQPSGNRTFIRPKMFWNDKLQNEPETWTDWADLINRKMLLHTCRSERNAFLCTCTIIKAQHVFDAWVHAINTMNTTHSIYLIWHVSRSFLPLTKLVLDFLNASYTIMTTSHYELILIRLANIHVHTHMSLYWTTSKIKYSSWSY